MDVCIPMLVNISVYSGHEDFREQAPLASVLTERWHIAPGVQRINLTVKGMRGTLFIPPGTLASGNFQVLLYPKCCVEK